MKVQPSYLSRYTAAVANSTERRVGGAENVTSALCDCVGHLQQVCLGVQSAHAYEPNNLSYNSDVGRMVYTIAILLMFSAVILLLMVRSIRRSRTTIEVETLLDAMRFREELDSEKRQKRKLQKAKNKVTAWLTRTNGKMWQSSPQILLPNHRTNSIQSGCSFLPEIVISNSEEAMGTRRQNSYTPSLSLIYDFGEHSRKNSAFSELSETIDLSQFSDVSCGSELAPRTMSTSTKGSQHSLHLQIDPVA